MKKLSVGFVEGGRLELEDVKEVTLGQAGDALVVWDCDCKLVAYFRAASISYCWVSGADDKYVDLAD